MISRTFYLFMGCVFCCGLQGAQADVISALERALHLPVEEKERYIQRVEQVQEKALLYDYELVYDYELIYDYELVMDKTPACWIKHLAGKKLMINEKEASLLQAERFVLFLKTCQLTFHVGVLEKINLLHKVFSVKTPYGDSFERLWCKAGQGVQPLSFLEEQHIRRVFQHAQDQEKIVQLGRQLAEYLTRHTCYEEMVFGEYGVPETLDVLERKVALKRPALYQSLDHFLSYIQREYERFFKTLSLRYPFLEEEAYQPARVFDAAHVQGDKLKLSNDLTPLVQAFYICVQAERLDHLVSGEAVKKSLDFLVNPLYQKRYQDFEQGKEFFSIDALIPKLQQSIDLAQQLGITLCFHLEEKLGFAEQSLALLGVSPTLLFMKMVPFKEGLAYQEQDPYTIGVSAKLCQNVETAWVCLQKISCMNMLYPQAPIEKDFLSSMRTVISKRVNNESFLMLFTWSYALLFGSTENKRGATFRLKEKQSPNYVMGKLWLTQKFLKGSAMDSLVKHLSEQKEMYITQYWSSTVTPYLQGMGKALTL